MTAAQVALELVVFGLKLYKTITGEAPDPKKLNAAAGTEVVRIDSQQAKDEAAENAAARRGDGS